MSSLFVFPCMDAVEFNLAARSLASFFRKNKNIGLVVIDGIHFIENQDFLNKFEKRQAKQMENAGTKGNSVEAMAEQEIPGGDDFFDAKPAPPREKSDQGLKQPFYTKRVAKTSNTGASRLDAKSFDQKLVDRAFGAIFELQKIYQFAIVKCQARPFMRKAADLQEEVMLKGLDSNAIPRSY